MDGLVRPIHLFYNDTDKWPVSVLKTVDRSVKEAVELFNREVKDLIENVDWAACARSHTEAHEHHAELVRMIGNIQSKSIVHVFHH